MRDVLEVELIGLGQSLDIESITYRETVTQSFGACLNDKLLMLSQKCNCYIEGFAHLKFCYKMQALSSVCL